MADDQVPPATSRAAEHFAKIAERAHAAIAPAIDAHADARPTDTLERFERELVPAIAPMLAGIVDNENIPEPVRHLVGAIVAPEHFTQSLLVGVAVGALISPVLGAATAPYVQSLSNEVWPHNTSVPLSPPEVALGVLRGNPDIPDPAGEAALSGISQSRLNALIYNTGSPPSPQELLLLYRRGQIDQARLETGIRQSMIRDEWMPEILALRFAPPGAGEVISGLLKAHLSEADASTKLAEAGIDPANLSWLLATAGRPYGTMEALQLLNRGIIDEARVRQVVAQSDINPDYTNDILNLRVYLPPPRSIVPMLRSGAITEARARTLLEAHGLQTQDADAFIAEAGHTATTNAKTLTTAQVVSAYNAELIPQAEAQTRLAALKYSPADVTLYIELADRDRELALSRAAVARVHQRFVTRRIGASQVTSDLAALGIPQPAAAQYLTLWTEEQAIAAPVLTVAQMQGALYRAIITLPDFVSRMHGLGFAGVDVKILAAEAFPPTKVRADVVALNPASL